jgi:hypothetical protein
MNNETANVKNISSYVLQVILWASALILLSFQIYYTRPMQDDYLLLEYLSSNSVLDFLKIIWEFQGGNLWVYGAQGLLLQGSLYSINFIVIAMWTMITLSVVSLCNYRLFQWFFSKDIYLLGKFRIITVISISYLGFEGLFTPGLIAAYSFHQAAFSHLWPITLLIIAISMIDRGSRNILLALVLGLLIGGANIAESFAALLILIFLFTLKINSVRIIEKSRAFYYFLIAGLMTSFTGTLLSPGFWNRAQNSVGLPDTSKEFASRLYKSFSSFFADLITHPVLYLVFIIGLSMALPKKVGQEKELIFVKIKLIFAMGLVLYVTLGLGSTFAYVSWHQSSGLYQIFIPLAYMLGIYVKSYLHVSVSLKSKYLTISIAAILLVVISFRAGGAMKSRATAWDSAFKTNYCSIKTNSGKDLIGAEMLYPGFNLGIEDISRWEWMREGYSQWIANPKFESDIKCLDD